MKRFKLLDAVEEIFRNAGFIVSMRCISRPSCFDFMAGGKGKLIFVKTAKNLSSISQEDVSELQKISRFLSASPIIVGEKTYKMKLEEDAVYKRYGAFAVSLKTLKNTISYGVYPIIEVDSGGYYIRVNGEAIRRRREELGLSIGRLAEIVGVSRITIYAYEKGMARASVSIAYKLEEALGIPVAKPINLFCETSKNNPLKFAEKQKEMNRIGNEILNYVIKKFKQLKFTIQATCKAPFDFIAKPPEGANILGGILGENEKNIERRIEEMKSIADIAGVQPLLVANKSREINGSLPLIDHKELEKVKNSRELIEML